MSVVFLFIEVIFKRLQFLVSAADAPQPPSPKETCPIADELDEACPNGEEANPGAFVSYGAVYEDYQREEQKRKYSKEHYCCAQESDDESHVTACATEKASIKPDACKEQSDEEKQQAKERSNRKDSWQKMHELQTAGVTLHQIDSGNAAVVNLLEELLEVCASLVPNPGIWKESAACSALVDAQAQVDVFTETH